MNWWFPSREIFNDTAYKHNLGVEVHKEWLYEIFRSDYLPVDNDFIQKNNIKKNEEQRIVLNKEKKEKRKAFDKIKSMLYKILPAYKVSVDNRNILEQIKAINCNNHVELITELKKIESGLSND